MLLQKLFDYIILKITIPLLTLKLWKGNWLVLMSLDPQSREIWLSDDISYLGQKHRRTIRMCVFFGDGAADFDILCIRLAPFLQVNRSVPLWVCQAMTNSL